MPEDIENYVHRIGRTGRRGKVGMSTTYVNRSIEEAVLLDLKHLLLEAKQKVPEFLQNLGGDMTLDGFGGTHREYFIASSMFIYFVFFFRLLLLKI
jgi:superfamily II DNA/RNA helicase